MILKKENNLSYIKTLDFSTEADLRYVIIEGCQEETGRAKDPQTVFDRLQVDSTRRPGGDIKSRWII